MNCADFEDLLTGYVDNTLAPEVRAAFESHAGTCAGCREFLADVTGAVEFMGRVADVEPPPDLLTRIAFQTPLGRMRLPLEPPGFFSRLATTWLRPVLQPRLAMGMAMTILSFAMLEKCTGVRVQHIQAVDLSPIRIWDGVEDKAFRVKDRAVKYYENIRLVYDVETRLRELDENRSAGNSASRKKAAPNQGVNKK